MKHFLKARIQSDGAIGAARDDPAGGAAADGAAAMQQLDEPSPRASAPADEPVSRPETTEDAVRCNGGDGDDDSGGNGGGGGSGGEAAGDGARQSSAEAPGAAADAALASVAFAEAPRGSTGGYSRKQKKKMRRAGLSIPPAPAAPVAPPAPPPSQSAQLPPFAPEAGSSWSAPVDLGRAWEAAQQPRADDDTPAWTGGADAEGALLWLRDIADGRSAGSRGKHILEAVWELLSVAPWREPHARRDAPLASVWRAGTQREPLWPLAARQ
jgi:hypothetical protein